MIDVKRFSGILNTDDQPESVLAPQHIGAKNIRFYGGANGLVAENVKGNYVIPNTNLPEGDNQCIGTFFDSVNKRIIWFNYNSAGNHGIYQLDINLDKISKIFLCGTDSATDILHFDLNYPVHSSVIVYRTKGDGDLLYWTDGLNRPKFINLDSAVSLAPFTEDMLNAAKNAPLNELTLSYSTDSTITVNNIYRKFFRFAYRFIYRSLEKSTFSPTTAIPLPPSGFQDPSYDNVINISGTAALSAGNLGDIEAVEIIGQQSLGSTFGDYFLITKIPSSEFTGTGGTDFSYRFINDSTYVTVPTEETLLPFSFLPDKANTLELLNGDVLVYGGITEGYDNIPKADLDVILYSGRSYGIDSPAVSSKLISSQLAEIIVGGNWTIIPLSGTGDAQVDITLKWFDGATNQTTTFNLTIPNTSTSLYDVTNYIWTQLDTTLTSFTVTQVGSLTSGDNANTITIACTAPVTITSLEINYVGYQNGIPGNVLSEQKSIPWSTQYRWGLIYFDERGKTNGVVSYININDVINNFSYISTDFYDGEDPVTSGVSTGVQLPMMMASINHTPPSWAKKMQWVRTPNQTLGSYLQLVTNDFQSDTDFLYFGIQNLAYTQTENTAFLPSYEFTAGDRIKVMAKYFSGGYREPYPSQLDLEILGTVELTMNSPNTSTSGKGTYIKVKKPTGYPFVWGGYSGNYHFIELYTPYIRANSSSELFYEFGQAFDIIESGGNRYHAGNLSNQNNTQPATYLFYDGGDYYHTRSMYKYVGATTLTNTQMQSNSYNDYYQSTVNSDSRGWPIDENAMETYNSVLVRWGGKYQPGTNINQLNVFQAANFDEVDRSRGAIRRFKSRDRILRVFQDRATGQYGVYSRFIQNNQGQSQLVTTNDIITTNNIQYYQGTYGVSGYPTNLVSTQNDDYFVDVVTGRCVRLGGNGLSDLGLAHKGQFYLSQLAIPYNQVQHLVGSVSKVMGFFDYFNNEYHVILQGGVPETAIYVDKSINKITEYDFVLLGGNAYNPAGDIFTVTLSDGIHVETIEYTATSFDDAAGIQTTIVSLINATTYFQATEVDGVAIVTNAPTFGTTINGDISIQYATSVLNAPQNYSFNESRNGFCCDEYGYHPEWATGANDMIYTWLGGQLWKHDNPIRCLFYNVHSPASIKVVFNQNYHLKKSWNSISEVASDTWAVPSLQTNTISYQDVIQESSLKEGEFVKLESMPSASIKRDANSPGGKTNGDFMKGNYLIAKFEKLNANNSITLSEVSARYTDSPLNVK